MREEWVLETARQIAVAMAGDGVTEIHTNHHREKVAGWSVDLAERVWHHARIPIELHDAEDAA